MADNIVELFAKGWTSGERSALWRKRQREDPEKHNIYKAKERERYNTKKERGQIKPIGEQNEREKRKTRRNWKTNQKSKRERDIMILKHVENSVSPPQSPELDPNTSSRKKVGRKKVKRDRAKAYREIFSLRILLDKERREKEKYKKREYRLRKANETEIDQQMKEKIKREDVRKSLTLHLLMVRKIKAQHEDAITMKEKRVIRDLIFKNSLLKKYKLGKYAEEVYGIKSPVLRNRRKKPSLLKTVVVNFIEREDSSRVKAGKKSEITRNGQKMKIRFINDTLKNIHAKFLAESESHISYSLFCKLKPFWVIKPSEKDRETCLCKLHENTQYKLNQLFYEKVIQSKEIDDELSEITCSLKKKACMYRECQSCKNKTIKLHNADGRQVSWYMWKNTRTDKERKNEKGEIETKKQSITAKQKEHGTLETLAKELLTDLERIGRHIYNIRHQYSMIKNLKENLNDNSVLVHIDFSENFNCKYEREIQSMHFGASQRQIYIHTGVAYLKNSTKILFSSFSENLKHSPAGIWAHLKPVLNHLKQEHNVNTVHFLSDGPTTQCRSKYNFYLLSSEIFELGFEHATWNFLEAGHGKGAPNVIGAVIKRQADSFVNVYKKDIMKAADLMDGLKANGTSIKLYEIVDSDVEEYEKRPDVSLKRVSETMKIHQIIVRGEYTISSRVLSCFCESDCKCYQPVITQFKQHVNEDQRASSDAVLQTPPEMNDISINTRLLPIDTVDEALVGKYCVVVYDGLPYPGTILDVDDEDDVEIKVMNRIGPNRFVWPLIEDRLWYSKKGIVTLLDKKPSLVTNRHRQIEHHIWDAIVKKLNNIELLDNRFPDDVIVLLHALP